MDDTVFGDPWPARQSKFVTPWQADKQAEYPSSIATRKERTLSSFSTGALPLTVGAYVLSTGEYAEYSAAGPGRVFARPDGPDILAPAEESETIKGRLAGGNLSGVQVRRNGTSVAAPQVARELLNFLAAEPSPLTALEIRNKFLIERSHSPTNPIKPNDPRRGWRKLK
jgi:Subtilase family